MVRPMSNKSNKASKIRKFGDPTNVDDQIIILPGHAWIPGQTSATIHESFIVKQINDTLYLIEEVTTGARGKCKLSNLINSPIEGEMYIPINGFGSSAKLGGHFKGNIVLNANPNASDTRMGEPIEIRSIFGAVGTGANLFIRDVIGSLSSSLQFLPVINSGGNGYTPGIYNVTLPEPIRLGGTAATAAITVGPNTDIVRAIIIDGGDGYTRRDLESMLTDPFLDAQIPNGSGGTLDLIKGRCLVGRPLEGGIINRGSGYSPFFTTLWINNVQINSHIDISPIFEPTTDNLVDYTIDYGGTGWALNDKVISDGPNNSITGNIKSISNASVRQDVTNFTDDKITIFAAVGIVNQSATFKFPSPLRGNSLTDNIEIHVDWPSTLPGGQTESIVTITNPGNSYSSILDIEYWFRQDYLILDYFTEQLQAQGVVDRFGDPAVILSVTISQTVLVGEIDGLRFSSNSTGSGFEPCSEVTLIKDPAFVTTAPNISNYRGSDDIDITGLIAYNPQPYAKKILTHRVTGFDGTVYKWNNITPVLNNGDDFFVTGEDLDIGDIEQD